MQRKHAPMQPPETNKLQLKYTKTPNSFHAAIFESTENSRMFVYSVPLETNRINTADVTSALVEFPLPHHRRRSRMYPPLVRRSEYTDV